MRWLKKRESTPQSKRLLNEFLMLTYFECSIKRTKEPQEQGKKRNYKYLLSADSYTETEANCAVIMEHEGFTGAENSTGYSLELIAKTDVSEVMFFTSMENDQGSWFDVKYMLVSTDEEGYEVIIAKKHVIVYSDDIANIKSSLESIESMYSIAIISIALKNYVDFYSQERVRELGSV